MSRTGTKLGRYLLFFLQRLLLVASALALGLFLLEIIFRVTSLEPHMLARYVYYQGADVPVHQVSSDQMLRYELRPGAVLQEVAKYSASDIRLDAFAPGDLDGELQRPYQVTINQYGARGPAGVEPKPSDVFRILFFGASTVYGAGVDDDETIPAQLEAQLNAQGEQRYEVWNFGTSGYVLGQMSRLARARLEVHDPDLVVVLHTNVGRRAFLWDEELGLERDFTSYLRADPYFVMEYFPPPPGSVWETRGDRDRSTWSHAGLYPSLPGTPELAYFNLMRWSAVFRYFQVNLMAGFLSENTAWPYGDDVSALEARALYRDAHRAGVPLVFVLAPETPEQRPESSHMFPPSEGTTLLSLWKRGREPAFYESHPPPPILAEHASTVLEGLRDASLLPTDPSGADTLSPED